MEENKKKKAISENQKNKDIFYGRKRGCLTIHGQHESDLEALTKFFDDSIIELAVVAREFGKYKIHPHGQGYFEYSEKPIGSVKNALIKVLGHDEFHLEVAKSTRSVNINYVYAVDKYGEVGFIVYRKNVEAPRRYNTGKRAEFWSNIKLKPFQQDILKLALKAEEGRSIFWFWEAKGNTGKSAICEYLHIFHGAIITGGSPKDMKYAFVKGQEIVGHDPVIILVDLARSDHFSATSAKALESIKNGLFFSGKYESGAVHATLKPHIFVFANYAPTIQMKSGFSEDRWSIHEIMPDNTLYPVIN